MNFKQILGGQIDHIHCIFSFFINQNVHRVQNQETISKPHNPISRSTGFGRKQLQPANGTSKPIVTLKAHIKCRYLSHMQLALNSIKKIENVAFT